MLDKLKSFKSKEISHNWDILQAWILIKEVLLKVKDILENHWEYNEKIEFLTKGMLTRAIILDTIFNHLFEISYPDSEWNTFILDENNDLYYQIPAIWVFFNWEPIFLNRNYIEALWAKDLKTLKEDIIQKKALEKYYTPESQWTAKDAILKLGFWEWYKDLKLTTVLWKTISWNSFWKKDWLEIRIWNDITYWTFKNTKIWDVINEKDLTLKTSQIIDSYIYQVWKIINIEPSSIGKLMIFKSLSEILDRVWNDGQFLMNITFEKNEKVKNKMICNNNYLNAIWLSFEELEKKVIDGTLYNEHYKKDTESLIKWLWETLKEDWYYITDFTMLDKNKVPKNYSWYRKLIVDKDLWINRTFGIWNNAISKDNADIINFLEEK